MALKILSIPFRFVNKTQVLKLQLPRFFSTKELTDDLPNSELPNPFQKEKEQCILCKYNIIPDYKNVRLLSQFQSPYTGRIYGKHITGLCSTKQKAVEAEIFKAQCSGLMPYYHKKEEYLKDPKLFNSDHQLRPHRF